MVKVKAKRVKRSVPKAKVVRTERFVDEDLSGVTVTPPWTTRPRYAVERRLTMFTFITVAESDNLTEAKKYLEHSRKKGGKGQLVLFDWHTCVVVSY